ncbi:MAG: carboxynorspermidine decarboxylase [Pseudomonadota bacterium]
MDGLDAAFADFDPYRVPSPCFVIDTARIQDNLDVLNRVQARSGASVLLALKAFSMFALAERIRGSLAGVCASGLYEARLGREEFGGEVHTYGPAYRASDLPTILRLSDHVVFNSNDQLDRFRPEIDAEQAVRPDLKIGLRVNPEIPLGDTPIYDPSSPFSRLGIVDGQLDRSRLSGVTGLHVHNLCEQGFEPLVQTVAAVEHKFGDVLAGMDWLNLGGGHHITRPDYPVDRLIEFLINLSETHGLSLYLEPGEAIAWEAGALVSEILDLTWNGKPIAVLDTSATAHMPDVLEAPYTPDVFGAGGPGEREVDCRLGGQTCLAGDVIGDYSFDRLPAVGDRLMFRDMAYYTMVKTTTFNGIALPSIALWDRSSDTVQVIKSFDYQDFRGRLS